MIAIASLVLVTLALNKSQGVERLDHLIYDTMVRVHQRATHNDVVIVAVDEKSLNRLGRWPWSRRVHADLLRVLTAAGATAVAIDILLPESDRVDAEGDALLASAIEDHGGVVLVTGPESNHASPLVSEVLPLPIFAAAAAGIAHVDFELDGDGICRKVFLHAGLGTPHWPALGLAMANLSQPGQAAQLPKTPATDIDIGSGWVRDEPILIPFSGPPGHFLQVSYVDVLDGRAPPGLFRDRLVFVGATAIGLGDFISTPVSTTHTLMSGVEANANVAAAILEGKLLRESPPNLTLAFNTLLVICLAVWLAAFSGRLLLFGYVLATVTTLLLSMALLFFRQLWVSPVIALLCQTALYVAWTWLDLGQLKRISRALSTQVRQQARIDRLTGLPNRLGLEERIKGLLENGEEVPEEVWLLIISTGRPRSVINMAGTRGKDALDKLIAARLVDTIPPEYSVYRMEGNEFAILVDHLQAQTQIEKLAASLVRSLQLPFHLRGDKFIFRPWIGAGRFPQDGLRARELIDNAHKAMNSARKGRSQPFRMYSEDLDADICKRNTIEKSLRNSSWKEEMFCVYQPQISLDSGQVVGVETLVRWRHPEFGDISPADFVPLAEKENLIVPVGNWILHQACMQAAKWRREHGLELRLGVNVSALQLESPEFLNVVATTLAQSGLPARQLELELTETALPADHDATVKLLGGIKQLGIELAVDDFGTGYCSLSYLKSFPIDRIKIDQSFVVDMHRQGESADITWSIVLLAKRLGLKVIAEGVERPEHLERLRALGCDEAQGYLVGKPMLPDELEALLMNHRVADSALPG